MWTSAAAAALGLVFTPALPAQAASQAESGGSWIKGIGGEGTWANARLESGRGVLISHGTGFRMICWYQHPGFERRSYGEFTTGDYAGQYGNIALSFVLDEVVVPHCD